MALEIKSVSETPEQERQSIISRHPDYCFKHLSYKEKSEIIFLFDGHPINYACNQCRSEEEVEKRKSLEHDIQRYKELDRLVV